MTAESLVVGKRAKALSRLLHIDIDPEAMLVIVPPFLGSQWYVDHPAPGDETAEIWFGLSAPERASATRSEIREAVRELERVIVTERSMLKSKRHAMRVNPTSNPTRLLDLTEHASKVSSAQTLRQTLRETAQHLDRIHADLTRRLR